MPATTHPAPAVFTPATLPDVTVSHRGVTGADADVLVVAMVVPRPASTTADPDVDSEAAAVSVAPVVCVPQALPAKAVAAIQAGAAAVRFRAGLGDVARLAGIPGLGTDLVLIVGLGRETPNPTTLRRAAGAATRSVTGLPGVTRAQLIMPATDEEQLRAVAEGALLGAYAFQAYRSKAKPGLAALTLDSTVARKAGSGRKSLDVAAGLARETAAAAFLTRELVNTSALDLYPESFATIAEAVGAESGFDVTVLDEANLADGGYGGLLAVGAGSARPPRLVVCEYRPRRPHSHVALIGKGITFDSGGLSLKPPASMPAMKADMAGAAAVLATVAAAARAKLDVRVTGYLALAENMPSGTAQRPSDVIRIFGGKTVEVLNTDAEGRLVLADAIVAASRLSPDVIIDVATLTGAATVALGSRTSGLLGTDDDLIAELRAAAAAAGEPTWHMPLAEELRPALDSAVADLANVSSKRDGGMITAALFLREFVGRTEAGPIPWAHFDVAGPAFNDGGAEDVTPKGGTGVPVRTLIRFLQTRHGG